MIAASLGVLSMTAACATAPAATAPAVAFENKLSWILRLEDQRILRDPPPAP